MIYVRYYILHIFCYIYSSIIAINLFFLCFTVYLTCMGVGKRNVDIEYAND